MASGRRRAVKVPLRTGLLLLTLARRPGACQRDEAAGLKVDSDSSMGVAGGRLLAEEVRNEPAPLPPEDTTPGLAIGWWILRRPAGAGSPTGGVAVLPVPRQSGRRLIPGRSRRRGRCGQLECVGLPDNRAVALDSVARRTPLMASIHLYFAGKQVGDTQKRGKPEMRSSCRKSLIGVGPARPRPCKCPPPQIPVSQSPF